MKKNEENYCFTAVSVGVRGVREIIMKKTILFFIIVFFLLICISCAPPTFDCTIDNNSDYPAELLLLYHKKATNTNNDTITLQPNEKTTIAFYYEGDNVRLISKNYNVLEKISVKKYVITNLQLTKYNIHNFLPISVTFLDNGMNILANNITKKATDKISAPSGNSEGYFFRSIKSDDIVLQPIEETTIGSSKYSIQKIANHYFLKIVKAGASPEMHKIHIDVSYEDIIISY